MNTDNFDKTFNSSWRFMKVAWGCAFVTGVAFMVFVCWVVVKILQHYKII